MRRYTSVIVLFAYVSTTVHNRNEIESQTTSVPVCFRACVLPTQHDVRSPFYRARVLQQQGSEHVCVLLCALSARVQENNCECVLAGFDTTYFRW